LDTGGVKWLQRSIPGSTLEHITSYLINGASLKTQTSEYGGLIEFSKKANRSIPKIFLIMFFKKSSFCVGWIPSWDTQPTTVGFWDGFKSLLDSGLDLFISNVSTDAFAHWAQPNQTKVLKSKASPIIFGVLALRWL
jgi:hypothetical protein